MAKSKADDYKGSGMSKGAYQKYESARKNVFGMNTKKKTVKKPVKTSSKPVYKSGFIGGKPIDYKTAKRGIITSLD